MPTGHQFPCVLTSVEVELPGWGWCWLVGWSSSRDFARVQYQGEVASGFLVKSWSALASIYGYFIHATK